MSDMVSKALAWDTLTADAKKRNDEIKRLRGVLESLLHDPEPTLDEPDTDAEVVIKMRATIREALAQ